MENDYKKPRILLLGGTKDSCEIVNEAHRMGIFVCVADYLTNSPAKKIADKSFLVDATDIDAITKLCMKENVDGLITGYVDMLLPYAEKICCQSGLPFWGDAKSINMCINKKLFKEACEESELSVVPWKTVNQNNYTNAIDFDFPVVIKPADNSGSRGVYKCYNKNRFVSLCQKAFEYSKSGELLVERLMNINQEFSVYYILCNGEVILTSMGDRFVNSIDNSLAPLGQGMLFPSVHLKEWEQKMQKPINRFFANNNMKEGFVFLQGFYENGEFYIHEIGYRLNGGYTYKIVEYYSGYNQIQELIRFSLTGTMDSTSIHKSDPYFRGKGLVLTLALRTGTIAEIVGVDEAKGIEGVIDCITLHDVGDKLTSVCTTAQVFAYVICVAKDLLGLRNTVSRVIDTIRVIDTNGNDMILLPLNPDRLI